MFTRESMKAYKSLEAYKRYMCIVTPNRYKLSLHCSEDQGYSITENTRPHEPWVYLKKSSGTVYCAYFTCMARLREVCSHVGALLFKVEMAVKMGLTQSSSTSKACQWNSSFRKEVTPATFTEILSEIKGKRTKKN